MAFQCQSIIAYICAQSGYKRPNVIIIQMNAPFQISQQYEKMNVRERK